MWRIRYLIIRTLHPKCYNFARRTSADIIIYFLLNWAMQSILSLIDFHFMEKKMRTTGFFMVIAFFISDVSHAAETVSYSYDAKGRLVRVVKSSGPNSGAVTTYDHDKADNRTRIVTSGASH